MAVVYKQTSLAEGTPLQFLGVYATRWEPDWGDPTVGFLEVDYRLDDALTDLASIQLIDNTGKEADEARKEIEDILRKLVGELIAIPQKQPEQMSRREAELLLDYGQHQPSCAYKEYVNPCTCDFLILLEQAQSSSEQSR